MTLISLNLSKMSVERKYTKPGKIEINNNVSVTEVTQISLNIGNEKTKAVKIEFEYATKYSPDVAHIKIQGEAVYATDEKTAKELVDSWKKTKDIKKPILKEVLNVVLARCSVISLMFSRELSLPPPIPIPKIE